MGDRYILTVVCPKCGWEDDNVYYAPTCGMTEWTCPRCKHTVDLEELTGITYEDASNLKELTKIAHDIEQKYKAPRRAKLVWPPRTREER